MPNLFDPIQVGPLTLPNRILMAPMTRGRNTREHVPTPVMAEYYAQRASAGLILSEAIGVSQEGLGWTYAPGLWSDAQRDAWRPVVAAVHAAGGRIFAQLWHMGRLVHPDFLGGVSPVSASATTATGNAHTYDGAKPYAVAQALDAAGIAKVVSDYRHAADNALEAGFDGVHIHAANGYLIDQFLRDSTNERKDEYGGSIANRVRLLDEVTQAVAQIAGPARTSVRLSPNGEAFGAIDSDPEPLFRAAAARLRAIGIAFLELRESSPDSTFVPTDQAPQSAMIREAFDGPLVLNSDFTASTAAQALVEGRCDAISFGRPFIANPDLARRLRDGLALREPDPETFYTQGTAGYADYPALLQRAS